MTCSSCGAAIQRKMTFCLECGAPQNFDALPDEATQPVVEAPRVEAPNLIPQVEPSPLLTASVIVEETSTVVDIPPLPVESPDLAAPLAVAEPPADPWGQFDAPTAVPTEPRDSLPPPPAVPPTPAVPSSNLAASRKKSSGQPLLILAAAVAVIVIGAGSWFFFQWTRGGAPTVPVAPSASEPAPPAAGLQPVSGTPIHPSVTPTATPSPSAPVTSERQAPAGARVQLNGAESSMSKGNAGIPSNHQPPPPQPPHVASAPIAPAAVLPSVSAPTPVVPVLTAKTPDPVVAAPPPSPAAEPPRPPADVAPPVASNKVVEPEPYAGPLSGSLTYSGPPVVQNGEVVFRNLPPASVQLELQYDKDVWEGRLSAGEGNTRRLILRNTKPGTQKKCVVTWRVI